MNSRNLSFAFGKNWKRYVDRYLNGEAVSFATRSFSELLQRDDLSGQSFVDVGCGSGLSSLVAYRLGASRVVSFDIDEDSVECCRYIRDREGNPENWEVFPGSILDEDLVDGIGVFDFVFSWGVLHHTGAMWKALENASRLVADDGRLVVAIYNRADAFGLYPDGRFGPSRLWVGLKKSYCGLPAVVQSLVDFTAVGVFVAVQLVTLRNPVSSIREYRKTRGMDLRIDIRDWLGGYPYEYAAVDEVFRFLSERGYNLQNLAYHGGLRCNEYVFRRVSR